MKRRNADWIVLKREQVRRKAAASFLYFVTALCWIEDKNTNQAIRFNLWPMQRDCVDLLVDSLRLLILKARQLGWTWLVAAYCLWKALFSTLQEILVISMDEDTAKEFLQRVWFILNRLPYWMVPKVAKDTSEILEFEHIDERGKKVNSVIKSLPTTPKGGQSKTPTVLVIDEACWNRYFREAYNATKPGIDAAGGKIIVISNSIKTAPGWPFMRHLYSQAIKGVLDFKRLFLPWWANPNRPTEEIWDDDSKAHLPRFKKTQLDEGMDEDSFSQHYPATEAEAISTMLGSYFGKTLSRHTNTLEGVQGWFIRDEKTGDVEFQEDRRGIVEIWRHPYHLVEGWDGHWWAGRYCLGADVSEGLGLSYSVAHVLDRHFDELACRIRTNRMDAWRWAEQLYMASEYYRNAIDWPETGPTHELALCCPERTGAGQTTVHRLSELGGNLYLEEVPATTGNQVTKRLGWTETNQSKHDLCEDLRHWFRTCKGTIYDAILLDEASTWIQAEGTNKLGPEEGHFGDCVISAGCAVQAAMSMGGSPKRLDPPLTGWRQELFGERGEKSPWVL